MELDPGLVCYRHCIRGVLIATSLPDACGHCSTPLHTTQSLLDTPYRLPYPFRRACQSPCAIVIRPTRGDFLHDYNSGDDLHIGVTDSDGRVLEFDSEGLRSDGGSAFSQCLVVSLLEDPDDPVWQQYWNTALCTTAASGDWAEERYEETTFNCYTFVLQFLRLLRPPILSQFQLSKVSFCSSFVVPRATSAARYIALYRKVKKEQFVALEFPLSESKDAPGQPNGRTAVNDFGRVASDRSKDGNEVKEPFASTGAEESCASDLMERMEALVLSIDSNAEAQTNFQEMNNRKPRIARQRKPAEPSLNVKSRAKTNGDDDPFNSNTSCQSDTDSDIEDRIGKVIDDLLKNRHLDQSCNYFTHYTDDIKRDLRSLVPKVPSKPKSFINNHCSLPDKPDNDPFKVNLLVQGSEKRYDTDEYSVPLKKSARSFVTKNLAVNELNRQSNKYVQEREMKYRQDGYRPHKVDCKETSSPPRQNKAVLNSEQQHRSRTLPANMNNSLCSHNGFSNNSMYKSPEIIKDCKNSSNGSGHCTPMYNKSYFRISKAENYCPEYDRFRSNSSRKKQNGQQLSSVWVKNNKFNAILNSTPSKLTYSEWLSMGSRDDIGPGEDELIPTIQNLPAVNTIIKCEVPSPPLQKERIYKTSYFVRNSPTNSVINHENEQVITTIPVEHGIEDMVHQTRTNPLLQMYIDTQPFETNDTIPVVITAADYNPRIGEALSECSEPPPAPPRRRKCVQRESTWRYGQEPCPLNYEGKLLGKIDISSKRQDWQTKGRPSTLSMPGYIYEDGVLTETRC